MSRGRRHFRGLGVDEEEEGEEEDYGEDDGISNSRNGLVDAHHFPPTLPALFEGTRRRSTPPQDLETSSRLTNVNPPILGPFELIPFPTQVPPPPRFFAAHQRPHPSLRPPPQSSGFRQQQHHSRRHVPVVVPPPIGAGVGFLERPRGSSIQVVTNFQGVGFDPSNHIAFGPHNPIVRADHRPISRYKISVVCGIPLRDFGGCKVQLESCVVGIVSRSGKYEALRSPVCHAAKPAATIWTQAEPGSVFATRILVSAGFTFDGMWASTDQRRVDRPVYRLGATFQVSTVHGLLLQRILVQFFFKRDHARDAYDRVSSLAVFSPRSLAEVQKAAAGGDMSHENWRLLLWGASRSKFVERVKKITQSPKYKMEDKPAVSGPCCLYIRQLPLPGFGDGRIKLFPFDFARDWRFYRQEIYTKRNRGDFFYMQTCTRDEFIENMLKFQYLNESHAFGCWTIASVFPKFLHLGMVALRHWAENNTVYVTLCLRGDCLQNGVATKAMKILFTLCNRYRDIFSLDSATKFAGTTHPGNRPVVRLFQRFGMKLTEKRYSESAKAFRHYYTQNFCEMGFLSLSFDTVERPLQLMVSDGRNDGVADFE